MLKFNRTKVPDSIKIEHFISVFRHHHRNIDSSEYYNAGESHDFWEFVQLEEGEINLLVDGNIHRLQPGQLIMYSPFSFHNVSSSSDAIITVVSFSCISKFLPEFSNTIINLFDYQKELLKKIIDIGNSCFDFSPQKINEKGMILRDGVSDLSLKKLSNLVEIFLIDLYEHNLPIDKARKDETSHQPDDQFAILTAFLSQNMHRSLTAEEISSELSISVSKLGKLCKSQCGCGPIDYFISLKIGAAKHMISEGNLNLTQISQKLSFSSVHYFSRLFKAKTGISPSQYAKQVCQNKEQNNDL